MDPTDKCQFSVSNAPSTFGPAGGSGSITITTARDCTWAVASEAGWIAMPAGLEGQGPAVVPYLVQVNSVPATRSGALSAAGQRLLLSQAAAPCRIQLSASGSSIGAAGGTLSLDVATLDGCTWNITVVDAWIAVASGSGSGSRTVVLTVAANSGASRIAKVTIADQTYTVTQGSASGPVPPAPPAPTPVPEPPAPEPPADIHLSGTISAVSGRCQAISFSLSGRSIVTNNDTDYKHGKCTDLSNGDEVSLDGRPRSTGVIDATKIDIKKNK